MLLSVRNLTSSFFLDEGELRAVNNVSFDIGEGQILALVGESGCGKTIVALSILDLIPSPGRVVSGNVEFEGQVQLSRQGRCPAAEASIAGADYGPDKVTRRVESVDPCAVL